MKKENERINEQEKLVCPKACVLNQLDDDRLALFSLWNPILSFSIKIDSRSHLQHRLF
jgi:hypothetical protein